MVMIRLLLLDVYLNKTGTANIERWFWAALAGWLSRLEPHPLHGKVSGSIPSPGVYGRQPINTSLSMDDSLSLPSSCSKNQFKKKNYFLD